MKDGKEVTEIREPFDLTGSYRAAGALAGCDPPHRGPSRRPPRRRSATGPCRVRPAPQDRRLRGADRPVGRGIARQEARADVAHRELVAMGYDGSEGTTRRVVAAAKESWEAGNRRTYMPWIPEPGSWLQFDFGDGPAVGGRRTWLFCPWLAWSRFRVVVPILDKTVATVISCLDVSAAPQPARPSSCRGRATVRTDVVARLHVGRVVGGTDHSRQRVQVDDASPSVHPCAQGAVGHASTDRPLPELGDVDGLENGDALGHGALLDGGDPRERDLLGAACRPVRGGLAWG